MKFLRYDLSQFIDFGILYFFVELQLVADTNITNIFNVNNFMLF